MKRAGFSSDEKYFACIDAEEELLVYEIAINKFIKFNFDSKVNTCTHIHWIPIPHKHNSPKKAKLRRNFSIEEVLLVLGTANGDVLVFNVESQTLFLHMAGRHLAAINDMCFYQENNTLFTCSSDAYIGIWEIPSGKQISKWKAGEDSVSAICTIDENNLLSSSTSILWWDISKKTVLKTFSGHSTEILKLLPVNVDSMNSCYFLSAAVGDSKINAWSVSICDAPVATFTLPSQPDDMDLSKVSSKDKPLLLSAVTNDGYLHLFEHTLNGNISQPVPSKISIEIDPKCEKFSIMSVKLNRDSESCLIAYGSSKTTLEFKRVKIREELKKKEKQMISDSSGSPVKLSLMSDSSRTERNIPVNGLSDSVINSYKQKLKSSINSSLTVADLSNPNTKEHSNISIEHNSVNQDINFDDPKCTVDVLLQAIEARNDNIIETIFKNNDIEFISTSVKNLPTSSLKLVVEELNQRLLQKYSVSICRWLKEILQTHLRYLSQCEDLVDSLSQIRKFLDGMKITETLHKMTVLQGLLNLQIQNRSDESDSDNEEKMDL